VTEHLLLVRRERVAGRALAAGDDHELVVDDRQSHPSTGGEIERGRGDRADRHAEAVREQRDHRRRLQRAAVDRLRLLVGSVVGRGRRRRVRRVLRPHVVQPAGERRHGGDRERRRVRAIDERDGHRDDPGHAVILAWG
jgi:hypothetical protein